MDERTSYVLTIDVEPDDRTFDPSSRPRWVGFETLLPEMRQFRRLLAAATGADVHFTWLLRLDSQIERTYGRPDWPFEQYRREIAELLAAGDEIGVHNHAWRWDEAAADWVADHGDPEWVGRCVEQSLATYRRATGRSARIFIHGDRFITNDVVRRLDRAGVECDLTMEPGRRLLRQIKEGEHATGTLPDLMAAPRIPYRPSADDYMRPGDGRRRLWMMPITTAVLPNPLTGSAAPDLQPLMIGSPFSVMRQVFENYLATTPLPVIASKGRSDVMMDPFNGEQLREFLNYLAEQARRTRLIFETPPEAIRRYRQTLAARGYGRREAARLVLATRFPESIYETSAPSPEKAADPKSAAGDVAHLHRELALERSRSRSLETAVERLTARLAEIESSRLWQWRRRWLRLRSLLGRASARAGSSPWRRLLGLLTRDGRRLARRAATLAAKKVYLWLEQEPVEIVVRRGARLAGLSADPYERWLAECSPRPVELAHYRDGVADLKYRPKISILMPVFNPPLEFLRAAIESVVDQVYPDWQLCIADDASTDPQVRKLIAEFARAEPRIAIVYRSQNGHISAAGNSALALAEGEFCAMLDHDDLLSADALYHVALALNRRPDLDVLYSDEDKVDAAGRFSEPNFKPQWCPDTLLGGNYVCHLLTARTELLRTVGGFREGLEGAQDFDLVLRLGERTNRVRHIPRILYHWRQHEGSTAQTIEAKPYAVQAGVRAIEDALVRRNEPGTVEPQWGAAGYYSVRFDLRDPRRVGVVIPTRDRAELLEACVRSLFEKTEYQDFEVLVVDNGSREPRTFELFRAFEARYPGRFSVHRDDGSFNFSRLVNRGVRAVGGAYVLLLNNDVEVLEGDWLRAMLEQAQRPSIGCVGARLLYPDGTVQHSGVIIGRGGPALHAFQCAERHAIGYGNRLRTTANYSAVTGACLLVRREVFEAVGGFDEALAVDFNDVDFCLRVREAGLQNVLVPQAELLHRESVSRGHPQADAESRRRHDREIALFRARWPAYLADDPCVSPHLAPYRGDLRIVA